MKSRYVALLILFCTITLLFCGCDHNKIAQPDAGYQPQTLWAQETLVLPDLRVGHQGFTCTGMTHCPSENCFYIVTFGKALPEEEEAWPTIVKLSPDFQILSEINIFEWLPRNAQIQGLSYDRSNDSLWFADFANGCIYNVSTAGQLLGRIGYQEPNGLAYDGRTDTLWVMSNTYNKGNVLIKNITKSGEELAAISVSSVPYSDQLFLDEEQDTLYFSAGSNYHGDNYIYSLSLQEVTYRREYILKDSYAIEGLYRKGNTLLVCNDGLYHSSLSNTNEIKRYALDAASPILTD